MSAQDPTTQREVERWIDRVDAVWEEGGMSRGDRRRLTGELQRDTEDALAGGAPTHEVLAPDHVRFAHDLAAASGAPVEAGPPPHRLVGLP